MKIRLLHHLIFFVCVIISHAIVAQKSKPGVPFSFGQSQGRITGGNPFKSKKVKIQTQIDNTKEKEKYAQIKELNPYGVGIAVDIDIKKAGRKNTMPDGGALWLAEIGSKDAYGLQFHFKKFKLPAGALLYIYNKDKSMKLGAYTSENNNPRNEFAIQIIKGDTAVVEYYEPPHPQFKGELLIHRVIHVFRPIFGGTERSGFGSAGACGINVACDPIYDQDMRAVARIATYDPDKNISSFASGALINSSSHAPYFLTANHTYRSSTTAGQYFAAWIFYFNYEFSNCSGSTIQPDDTHTIQGAYLRSKGQLSDYMLLELSDNPKNYYQVTYLGWDAGDYVPVSVVGIHHPDGDVKKISLQYSQPVPVKTQESTDPFSEHFDEVPGGLPQTDLKVAWDEGVTERGSSGSPLIDMNSRKIVGQLHGGNSSCNGTSVYYIGPDYYGRLAISWSNPDPGFPTIRSFLTTPNSTVTTMYGDYNGDAGTTDPYVVIKNITLTTNAFESPKNKLLPEIETHGATGTLTYSWSPATDFSNPNLTEGVIDFKLQTPPPMPLTRTYTLTVTPQNGVKASSSITITLYDCENKTISKDACLNSDVQLGKPGSTAETYAWSPTTNLTASNIANPVFNTSAPGVYKYILTAVSNGCSRKETYDIYVEDVPPPGSFTPSIKKQLEFGSSGKQTSAKKMFKIASGGYMLASFDNDGRFITLDESLNTIRDISTPWVDDGTNTGYDRTYQDGIAPTSDGGYMLTGLHNNVRIMAKYSATSQLEWRKNFESDVYCRAIIQAKNGDYLVTTAGANSNGTCLVRYSSTGSLLWKHCYSYNNVDESIIETADGGFVIGGNTGGIAYDDAQVMFKVDANGNFKWKLNITVAADDAMIIDGDYIVLTNTFKKSISTPPLFDYDYRIMKLNSNTGEIIWEKRCGGTSLDVPSCIIKTSDNGYLVGGWSKSPAGDYKSEDSRGDFDYWIIKLDRYGNKSGDKRYGGLAIDEITSIVEKVPGEYLLAGTSWSGVSGDKNIALTGTVDTWVIHIGDGGYVAPSDKTTLCTTFPGTYDNSAAPTKNVIVSLGTQVQPDLRCPDPTVIEGGAKLYVRASDRIIIKNTRIFKTATFSAKVQSINLYPCDLASGRLSESVSMDDKQKISAEENTDQFELYPNITTGLINIRCRFKEATEASLSITSTVNEIHTEKIERTSSIDRSIDLSGLASGIYFVRIQTQQTILFRKVILSK